MKLSVVTTLYKSEGTIAEFVRRASAAAAAITPDYEIVMVDDGSPDRSLQVALDLAKADSHLKVVELSRNFGHHKALMTGLRHAVGEFCFLIDSDLEEAPELLDAFWKRLNDEGFDVVYGYQEQRDGGSMRRLSGAVAYKLFDMLLSVKVPTNHLTVRLMRRGYVDSLLLHRETQLVIGGLWVLTGFKQQGVKVDKKHKEGTTYSAWRRWQIFLDSVTNFSETPLVMIFYVGLAISVMSGLVTLVLLLRWLFGGVGVAGWVSVILSVWLLGGLAILFIGIVGIYLAKVFIETKGRPLSIVRAVHQVAGNREPSA